MLKRTRREQTGIAGHLKVKGQFLRCRWGQSLRLRWGQSLRLRSPQCRATQPRAFLREAGQAAVEIAVMGSLILLIFSALLTYGQRMDAQVEVKMEAFRKALNRAYRRNASVSYTLKEDKRFYNLLANFGESQPTTLASSAMVMWQKGVAGCQDGEHGCSNNKDDKTNQSAFAYYEVNNQSIGREDWDVARPDDTDPEIMIPRYVKRAKTIMGEDDVEIKVPASVWKDVTRKTTQFSSIASKQENKASEGIPSTIDNKQTMKLTENIYTKAYLRFDKKKSDADENIHVPEYVYEGENIDDDQTVWIPGTARQGVWFNDAKGVNRVEYDPTIPEDAQIIKWRNWQTKF